MTKEPTEIAQGQLDAYNRRDIDAFVDFFRDDIEVFNFPGNTPTLIGMDEFHKMYEKLFRENPSLHCELVGRFSLGTVVIDQERVTGIVGKSELRVIAIYEIEDHLIKTVRFIR